MGGTIAIVAMTTKIFDFYSLCIIFAPSNFITLLVSVYIGSQVHNINCVKSPGYSCKQTIKLII